MYAVIRIRGTVNIRKDLEDTMRMIRLGRNMHCVVLNKADNTKGILQKAKDLITWGEIDDKVLKHLVEKRGRKAGNKKLTKEEVDNTIKNLKEKGKVPNGIKPVFRLTPPSKGFKHSVKQHYPKGELGYRGEKINDLLKRMI